VGIGSWQLGLHGLSSGRSATAITAVRTRPQQTTNDDADRAPTTTAATIDGSQLAELSTPTATILVVGSPAEAATVQQLVDAAGDGHGQAGLSPAYDTVMEVGPDVDVAELLAAFGFENEQRTARGIPAVQVQDLR